MQILAWYLILKPVVQYLFKINDFTKWTTIVLWTGIICLMLKVLLHGLVVLPSLAVVSYTIREFIVGYIHLILLGGMTMTCGAILLKMGILPLNAWNRVGWMGLLLTFILMEVVLFGHALRTWQGNGNAALFIRMSFYVTLFFPVFATCMVYGVFGRIKFLFG